MLSFFKNIFLWFKAKSIRWIAALLLIVVVIFIISSSVKAQNAAQEAYQTIKLERGDLIVIVGATGIVDANQTAELSWETTGRVESVNVKINDHVAAGDILADLADNTLPQSVILAQADLVTAQRELEDVINSDTDSAEAYATLLEAEQDLRDAEDDRDQWNYNDADIGRVNDARADFIALEEEYKIYKTAYEAVENLPADDPQRVKVKEERDEFKLVRDKALRTLNYILGKAYGQQVAEDFADYDVAEAKLDDAQREWDRVKNGPNADDISAAEAKVAAAEATVSLGWVEAPFDGTITQAIPKVGDRVSSGELAFRMDDLNQLYMDVEISEVDINRVKVGQEAELTFDAISGAVYTGEVTEVSSVGVDSGSGVDFTVTLKIVDPDEQVKPGMTAAVNIIVSEETDILTIPSRAVRLDEGERFIYVLRNGQLQKVVIGIGASSDTNIEITSGDVKEGDLIVLNPPFDFDMNGGQPAFTR
jgi:HlyD family secretion protein